MRTTLIFIFSFLFWTPLLSQNNNKYDEKMVAITKDIANKIRSKRKNLKVAVWDFTSTLKTKKEQDELGEFISQDFSIHFANINDRIQVLDRDHFKQIMNEHGLHSEGYIAPETAKKIGQFTQADAVITGTIDVGYNSLILRIKIIDIETASQLAGSKAYIPINEDLKVILKNTDFKGIPSLLLRTNPSEKENNTRTSPIKDCEKNYTGDYFIKNTTGRTQLLDIRKGITYSKSYRIENNQTLSLLNLFAGDYYFTAYVDGIRVVGNIGAKTKGQFRVEKCKSFTYYLGSSVVVETKKNGESSVNSKKNYRICFNNVGSNRHSWGDIKVTLYKNGKKIRSIDVRNGQEECIYNLSPNSVYTYTYRNFLIGTKKGQILIEEEKNMVQMINH
mgnify:CR=1 FL=1